MKRVIVIGGGFAGLSASVFLAENNFEVTLLEASPKFGGRAYSLYNKASDDFYDNGQHILMGCYNETLSFLKKIGTADKLFIQKSLCIPFVRKGGKICKIDTMKKFYPFNLLYGILNYKALSLKDRFKIIDFFLDLIFCESCDLKNKTVKEWLKCKKQSVNSINSFWDILVIGALNTTIDKASAETFSDILKRIFLSGNESTVIIIPQTNFSQMYINDSLHFIKANYGKIKCSERVERIEVNGNKIISINTDKNFYSNFDYAVFALPPYSAEKIINNSNVEINIPEFHYSPIINVHLWLKENPFKEKFYGLVDSRIHWLFNHNKHITLTTSAAKDLIELDNSEIKRLFCSEMELYFPIFHTELVIDSIIIKEKRATFIPDIESTMNRKKIKCSIDNLVFAGDWIDTGLPGTIESAVVSGKMAAENVIFNLK